MTGERTARDNRDKQPRGRGRGAGPRQVGDAFAVLGLEPAAQLTDQDVRAGWRRIAAATHPDRADGGDPERFALAAAAYTELRTVDGRIEARARLERARRRRWFAILPGRLPGRVRRGRPVRLAGRVLAAAGVATAAVLAAGRGPASPALVVGALTWLLLTARRDLIALGDLRLGERGERDERGQPGQPGSGPVATGLAGSADQADQDPT